MLDNFTTMYVITIGFSKINLNKVQRMLDYALFQLHR